MAKVVHIWIEAGRYPVLKVEPDPVHVDHGKSEEVEWVCDDGAAQIRFDSESPFRAKFFTVPHGGGLRSGPPIRGAPGTTYTYRVELNRPADNRTIDKECQLVVDGP